MDYPLSFTAAILEKNNAPLVIDTVTFDGPLLPGQVLVRVHYSGICGKQIEEITATMGPDPYLPHLLGHEGSGIVADTGPGVRKVKPGDHVVLHWMKGGGMDSATPLYHRKGVRVNAGWVTTFNEYAVVSENRITAIAKDVPFDVACLFGCAVTTGVGVILNEARVRPNESVAVFGCGGVGLMAIQGAKVAGADPIIAVDVHEEHLSLAKKLGATHAFLANDQVIEDIRNVTGRRGADYVILALGSPKGIELGVKASAVPGSVYFVGVPPRDGTITVSPLDIHRKRMLVGSTGGGSVPDRDIPSYILLYKKNLLSLKDMMRVLPFADIQKGIDLMRSGKMGRCVVRMG